MSYVKRVHILVLAIAAFSATLFNSETLVAADDASACQPLCVLKITTSRLALYSELGGKPRRMPAAETVEFAKNAPFKIVSGGIVKGQVQIETDDGKRYWVNDFHIKANVTLERFTSGPDHSGVGGVKVGGSRGYGDK